MQILPIRTPILKQGDDLAAMLIKHGDIHDGDIVVVSSKAVATTEGAAIDLSRMKVTKEAERLAKECGIRPCRIGQVGKSPAFCQAVLEETKRMNGSVIRSAHGVILTELHPEGFEGTLLVPNAGLDRSNIDETHCIGWPRDPVASAKRLREKLGNLGTWELGIILSDSGLSPRRIGVTAFALAVAGIDPLRSLIGTPDLHGQDMLMTVEAVADQLATAGNHMMGNAAQSTPAAVIRDHGIPFSEYCGWVPGIEREKDMYRGVI